MSLRRQIALGLTAATVFAIPWQEVIVVPAIGSVMRALGMIAFGFVLLNTFESGRIMLRRPPLFVFVAIGFVVWTAMTFFWTADPASTREIINTYLQLLMFAWVITEMGDTEENRTILAQAFVFGAWVVALNVLYIFLAEPDIIRSDGRVTALGGNQNDIAAVMAISIALAWWLAARYRNGLLALLNMLYVPIALIAILLTGSRGGSIAAVVSLLAIPLSFRALGRGKRAALLLILGVSVAVLVAAPDVLLTRAAPLLTRVGDTPELVIDSDYTGRAQIWGAGFTALLERPVFGYGADSFTEVVLPWLSEPRAPHNTFLSVAVGSGLIGLTLFLTMVGLVVLGVMNQPDRWRRPIQLALLGALLISMMPLGWEHEKTVWFLLALLSAEHVIYIGRVRLEARAEPS